ncbi:MAG: FTR1 family iron permease [Scytolyngbya sp. HA4215-MV1]|jgi:high-affinity iron transporter|nr:FTR1 family iron permease [Scytolyngbya sp. HA4215-MV1]
MPFNFTVALPAFVITLREGVEAALVVGIVLAYLKKAEQTHLNPWVFAGIGGGIGASGLIGWLLNGVIQSLTGINADYAPVVNQALQATFGLLAIVMLSWMLVWMTQQAKRLKAEVEGTVGTVLKNTGGSAWGIFGLVFFAVLREGFETVLFLAAQFQSGWVPVLGAIVGLLGATLIGILLFKFGIQINLRRFFQIMGVFLLLIVAGLVVSALKHGDAAIALLDSINPDTRHLCFFTAPTAACVLGPQVWDFSTVLPDRQFPGILFKTLLGYRERLYLVQTIAYVGFLLTVGGLYWQSITGWQLPTGKTQTSAAPPVQPQSK